MIISNIEFKGMRFAVLDDGEQTTYQVTSPVNLTIGYARPCIMNDTIDVLAWRDNQEGINPIFDRCERELPDDLEGFDLDTWHRENVEQLVSMHLAFNDRT